MKLTGETNLQLRNKCLDHWRGLLYLWTDLMSTSKSERSANLDRRTGRLKDFTIAVSTKCHSDSIEVGSIKQINTARVVERCDC